MSKIRFYGKMPLVSQKQFPFSLFIHHFMNYDWKAIACDRNEVKTRDGWFKKFKIMMSRLIIMLIFRVVDGFKVVTFENVLLI